MVGRVDPERGGLAFSESVTSTVKNPVGHQDTVVVPDVGGTSLPLATALRDEVLEPQRPPESSSGAMSRKICSAQDGTLLRYQCGSQKGL